MLAPGRLCPSLESLCVLLCPHALKRSCLLGADVPGPPFASWSPWVQPPLVLPFHPSASVAATSAGHPRGNAGSSGADTFARTVASGGLGQSRQRWRLDVTNPSTQVLRPPAESAGSRCRPPDAVRASSLPTASTNTDLATTVSLTKAATGGGTYMSLLGRRIAGQGTYQLDLKLAADKSLRLSLSRTVAGTQTSLGTAVTAVKTYAAGTPVHVRLRVRGTGTATLIGKAWVGATEPSTWSVRTTDSPPRSPGARHPGVLGILVRHRDAGAGRHHR